MSDNRTHVRDSEVWGLESLQLRAREADDGDGLTIEGYAAVFRQPAEIVDWAGHYTEQILPGSFLRSLSQRGPNRVRMQFQHGHDPVFGELPIGVWEDIHEDAYGLRVTGRIHDNWHTVPIRAAIESGALDGMSIKFRVVRDEWDYEGDPPSRSVSEIALLEAGVVVDAAYSGTMVGLRSKALDLWRSSLSTRTVDPEPEPVPVPDPEPVPVVEPTPIERAEVVRVSLAEIRWFLRQHAA